MVKIIFYKPSSCTHYKSLMNGKVFDPYDLFQSKNTQGFCQMFAFFITVDEISEFKEVGKQTTSSPVDIDKFNKLVHNTQMCATKTLDLIESDKEIMKIFKYYFNDERKEPNKGIKKKTTCEKYLKDFRLINEQIDMVKDYIIDNLVTGTNENRDMIYFSYHNDSDADYNGPISKLCVQPTEGETQYEAFQSILASIMSATHGQKKDFEPTPYDLLCHNNDILLMDWKKNTKPTKTDIKWIEINNEKWESTSSNIIKSS